VYILGLSIAMDLICIEYMGWDGTNIGIADENETELENLREESVANDGGRLSTRAIWLRIGPDCQPKTQTN